MSAHRAAGQNGRLPRSKTCSIAPNDPDFCQDRVIYGKTKVRMLYGHEDGDSLNLVITPGIDANDRIVIRKEKSHKDAGER